MTTQHTSGPWTRESVVREGVYESTTIRAPHRVIAEMEMHEDGGTAADAALISAAPQLLSIARYVREYLRDPVAAEQRARDATDGNYGAFQAIREGLDAAIAKAEGQS